MISMRKLAAVFCVAVVLLIAISPGAPGLAGAMLVPLFFLIAGIVVTPMSRELQYCHVPAVPSRSALSPRAPPAQ